MAIITLADIAKRGLCRENFESYSVYDEIETVCGNTTSSTTFQSCLQFVENLVNADEQVVSSSPRIVAFLDTVMQRVVSNLKSVVITSRLPLM